MAETAREMSLEAYLALDAASDQRHEFLNGLVLAMAGASPRHNVVAANLTRLVGSGLVGGPCTVFDSGQRVRVAETGGYVYPDLVVTCERPSFTDERPRSLTNPLVVIEVLSKSTRENDEGAKVSHYRRIRTVNEILLVDSQTRRASLYRRIEEDEWLLKDSIQGTIALASLDVRLAFDDIYAKTEGLPLDD